MDAAPRARILLVEDDGDLRRWLRRELEHEGYEVRAIADGAAAVAAMDEAVDLVLLDVMLPNLNGVEVCRRMRARSRTPVILVTARDAVTDRVAGLDAGADDYLCKPFAIEELLARIRVQLRHGAEGDGEVEALRCGSLVVDPAARTVAVADQPIELTKTEFDLLEFLVRHPGIVHSRESILRAVWGYDFVGESKVIDVYIRYLRSKIDEPFALHLIQTVRGVGYVLRPGPQA